jgi:hypothetical protein
MFFCGFVSRHSVGRRVDPLEALLATLLLGVATVITSLGARCSTLLRLRVVNYASASF